jgi:hypothetical protein
MNKIIINNWYGRLGNNILQILNCINIAIDDKYNIIQFPKHSFLKDISIKISNENFKKKPDLKENSFNFYNYYMKRNNIRKFSYLKQLFQKYILPIFIVLNPKNEDICFHIRSGDIIKQKNKEYIQPPLYFYLQIIHNTSSRLISEDLENPVCKWLVDNKTVIYKQQDLKTDLEYLIGCKTTCFGYGTFGFIILLLNNKLEKLYLADFVYDKIRINWKIELDNVNIEVIKLPNYIKKFDLKYLIDYNYDDNFMNLYKNLDNLIYKLKILE